MVEQWNGGMMGFKKMKFKAHNFAWQKQKIAAGRVS